MVKPAAIAAPVFSMSFLRERPEVDSDMVDGISLSGLYDKAGERRRETGDRRQETEAAARVRAPTSDS
jgi:hypothetical protein